MNQFLVSNPTSQFIINSFNNLQAELLQIFTSAEIGLLLEVQQHANHDNLQTDYIEVIEQARSPQLLNYRNPQ